MKKSFLLLIIILLFSSSSQDNSILAVIKYPDGVRDVIKRKDLEAFYVFMGRENEDKIDEDSLLQDAIMFRLRLKQAINEGIYDDSSIVKETNEYKKKISLSFLMNEKLFDPLVKEYYERSKLELRASHILFFLKKQALPKDTAEVYEKALEVKKMIEDGMTFEDAAVKFSQDPSVKKNKGDLGYFSVGNMVYPFETGAYSMLDKIGHVSNPVRTQFGYHLIKIVDSRDARSSRYSHIFISLHPKAAYVDSVEAYYRINELKKRLQTGESFETLARYYSEDTKTSENGGDLGRFNEDETPIKGLEAVAKKLKKEGDVSEIERTNFGLHILKLTEKKLPPFSEAKHYLKKKVLKERGRLIAKQKEIIKDLKNQFSIKQDVKLIDSIRSLFKKPVSFNSISLSESADTLSFLTINDKHFRIKDFLNYLKKTAKNLKVSQKDFDLLKDEFLSLKVLEEGINRLEMISNDFADAIQKYRSSSAAFLLAQKKIWQKINIQDQDLKKYYEKNKDKYRFKDRVMVTALEMLRMDEAKDIYRELTEKKRTRGIISKKDVLMLRKPIDDSLKILDSRNPKHSKIRRRLFKELNNIKVDNKPRKFEKLKSLYKATPKIWSASQSAWFEVGKNKFVDMLRNKKDGLILKPFYYRRRFYILRREKYEKARQMSFEEARETVLSEFQEKKYNEEMKTWNRQLRKNAIIEYR